VVRTLSHAEARTFYDRMGAKQDTQRFYEDAATGDLVAHGSFERARAVVEFGCGTGRFAKGLLEQHTPPTATYLGVDVSPRMVELARERLDRFGERASVRLSDGEPRIDAPDGSCDRFVSNYVLDLLSDADCAAVVREASRILPAGGLVCLVSLTFGFTRISRLVERTWSRLHAYRPALVGGCRPIELLRLLPEADWEVRHRHCLVPFGVPSEVVVAERR
jgi:ubiquinone/menaquinone biosynthesis C-methylase UbiE